MIPHVFRLGRRDKQENLYRLGKLGGSVKVYVLRKDYYLRDISGCSVSLNAKLTMHLEKLERVHRYLAKRFGRLTIEVSTQHIRGSCRGIFGLILHHDLFRKLLGLTFLGWV